MLCFYAYNSAEAFCLFTLPVSTYTLTIYSSRNSASQKENNINEYSSECFGDLDLDYHHFPYPKVEYPFYHGKTC